MDIFLAILGIGLIILGFIETTTGSNKIHWAVLATGLFLIIWVTFAHSGEEWEETVVNWVKVESANKHYVIDADNHLVNLTKILGSEIRDGDIVIKKVKGKGWRRGIYRIGSSEVYEIEREEKEVCTE